jgi:hypothetical protein
MYCIPGGRVCSSTFVKYALLLFELGEKFILSIDPAMDAGM